MKANLLKAVVILLLLLFETGAVRAAYNINIYGSVEVLLNGYAGVSITYQHQDKPGGAWVNHVTYVWLEVYDEDYNSSFALPDGSRNVAAAVDQVWGGEFLEQWTITTAGTGTDNGGTMAMTATTAHP